MKEDKLIKFLMDTLYASAKKFDEPFKANRDDNRRFYKGDQWRKRQPSYKSKPVTNYLSLIVRDETAILSDNSPIINVRPRDAQADLETSLTLTKLIKHIFYKNSYPKLQYKLCKIAAIEGICYWRPNWNPLLNDGEGDIEILVEKADSILRDPSGEDNYFIIEKELTLAEIYRNYPEAAPEVKANIFKEGKNLFNIGSKRLSLPVQSTDKSMTAVYEGSDLTVAEQYARVKFNIFWIKDDSVSKIEEKDKETHLKVPKALYPYGRWIFVANDKIKLADRPCVVKHFPLVEFIPDFDPDNDLAGITNIDYCKQSQKDYNSMYGLIKDWFEGTVYPRFKFDKRSGLDPRKIRNKANSGIPTMNFEWDRPPALPNEVFHFTNEAKTNIEYVSAMNDITQGRRPSSITAASAIHLLQEAGKTMIRPKARLLEESVKKLGELLIDLIQYGYSKERMIRICGGDEVLKINQTDMTGGAEEIKNDVRIGDYDIYIEPDSTMPKSRIERFQIQMDLFDKGASDRQAILAESGLHDWQEIEKRLKEKEEAMKQQEAQAQQQQAQMQQQQAEEERKFKEAELDIKRQELEIKREELKLKGLEAMKPAEKKE